MAYPMASRSTPDLLSDHARSSSDDDDNVSTEHSRGLLTGGLGDVERAGSGKRRLQPRSRLRGSFFAVAAVAGFLSLLLLLKLGIFDSTTASSRVSQPQVPPEAVAPPPSPDPTPDPTPVPSPALVAVSNPDTSAGKEASTDADASSFRRPDSDYILDPSWDFNTPPTVREYNWTIQNVEANPDGVYRTLTTINGKFPGEMIRCNEGDTVVVNVENRAINSTSLHWHGLFQNGTNHMDGTPGATQCPIAPGGTFRYEFTVKGQAGTYFYHGHQGADALDGLVGPFIIHSPDEAKHQLLPYETDRVVLVQDWYHDLSGALLIEALESGSENGPMPNGALINGGNIVDCDLHPDRSCDNSTARLPAFDLAPDANHRLRFINVGGFAWLEVNLDRHHNLPITEIDGVDIEPSSEHSLLLAPGQRYSVVLTANETSADAFWMRARICTHCFSEYALAGEDKPFAMGIVRYTAPAKAESTGAAPTRESSSVLDPARLPTTESDSGAYIVVCRDMNTQPYQPVPPKPAPEIADHSYYFRVNLEIGDWRLQRGVFNQSSYRPNLLSPVLHRAIDGLHEGNDSFRATGVNGLAFDAHSELVLSHAGTPVVDLVLQNFDEGSHPLHLHGHQMFVLGSGLGYFPGYQALGLKPNGKGLLDPNNATVLANPVRRDVATVEGFGWTVVRVVLDNPGVWKFHCHMIWHGDGGMGMLLLSRTDQLGDWTLPEANRALCAADSKVLELGAAPKDSIWYGHKEEEG